MPSGTSSQRTVTSVPWAAALARAGDLKRSGVLDVLTPTPKRQPQLYLMEPYDRRREPLIMIHGLLSTPLPSLQYHTDDLDRFEALTGIESPRIAEVMPATDTAPAIHETDQARLAAYQAWRHVGTAG